MAALKLRMPSAEPFAQRSKLTGAEQKKRNGHDEEDLGETKPAFHFRDLLDINSNRCQGHKRPFQNSRLVEG